MNTWTPLFGSILDSSVWEESDHVLRVFIAMLALKDSDHVVRKTAFQLGRRSFPCMDGSEAEAKALDALRILSSPDKKRLEPQPHDGKRIMKVADGWLVLNGQKYQDLMSAVSRRIYKAKWARDHKKGKPLTGEMAYLKAEQRGEPVQRLNRIVENHLPPAPRRDLVAAAEDSQPPDIPGPR